ncbi:hypothetical protein JAAARDRAFT_195846 [Jaapia argillacea MUCL 33604]|uniref:Uncharacterized protein n=1 Tax=Jaapia argillacea MUCL 33604 TaxID=933084 RepID=A0A067PYR0_9AGAM|nr:hypothetical protein JAAARDRAFT_195846 [Jaapia argillacea MUCL 33604]
MAYGTLPLEPIVLVPGTQDGYSLLKGCVRSGSRKAIAFFAHQDSDTSPPTMGDYLNITSVQAKSTVPLYVREFDGSRPSVQRDVWTWLWTAGYPIPSNAFTAFDATSSATVALGVACDFNLTAPTSLYLRALFNGIEVLSSPTPINPWGTGAAEVTVRDLAITNILPFPIAYRGNFVWVLANGDGETVVTGTTIPLEIYVFGAPTPAAMVLWMPFGISVNLLRVYLPVFDNNNRTWAEIDARRALVERVFGGPFSYDTVYGAPHYAAGKFGVAYWLELYFQDLEAGAPMWINCYDMAGIIQVALTVHPGYDRVHWNFMQPYGLINPTFLKGHPLLCNNPFFANAYCSPLSVAPQDYDPNQNVEPRSMFANHAFIALEVDNQEHNLVLDATCGPHVGNEQLDQYLAAAIDTRTNYYTAYYHTRPGNVHDIHPTQVGVVGLLTLASTASRAVSIEPRSLTSVELAVDRAKVDKSDPPHLTRVNYNSLQKAMVQKLGINLTTQSVQSSSQGSRSYWRLGSDSSMVEIELHVTETPDAAVGAMQEALSCVSAPLDVIFPSNSGLGQCSLSGVGGRGYILFVRDNVFVTLQGMASSEDLKEIAGFVDQSLKDDEVDVGVQLEAPILRGEVQGRQVKSGEIFEVTAPVEKAGWMDASVDLRMIQLINVDREHATFKFHAAGEGSTEIQLVFIHEDTMQTTSIKVAIEIWPRSDDNPMLAPP